MTARKVVDEVRFEEMWRQGASYRQITQALGILDFNINAIRKRLGLPTRRPEFSTEKPGPKSRTDIERNASIVLLRKQGALIPDLAAQFNLTAQRIRAILRDRRSCEPVSKPKPTIQPKPEAQQPSDNASHAAPDLPPHPFWNADRDAVLLRTKGTHSELAALAALWGQSSTYVRARWHRLVAA